MPTQWSAICESAVTHAGVTYQHGRVTGYVSDETPSRTALRPVDGATKWIGPEQDAALMIDVVIPANQLPYSDAILAGTHELAENQQLTIKGVRMLRQVADVDPLWASLVAAGTIQDEPADITLSSEVQAAVDAEDAADALTAAKATRLAARDTRWASQVAAGLPVTVGGVTKRLGCSEGDVALLNGKFSLVKEAIAAGMATADGPFTVTCISGERLSLTYAGLLTWMLTYGFVRESLESSYSDFLEAVNAANTVDAVNAVSLPSLL